MNIRFLIFGTLAYTLITFPLAAVWHAVLLKQQYLAFGYFEGEPNFAVGFLTIFLQGVMLSLIYNFIVFKGSSIIRGLKFAAALGVFFWTSHVLALVAKQSVPQPMIFIVIETFYLVIQFGLFGLMIGFIGRKTIDPNLSVS